jgi:uncharacterized protein
MENNFNIINDRQPTNATTGTVAKSFITSVFSWMAAALAITGIVAYQFGTTPEYIQLLIKPEGGLSIFGYIVMFAPIGIVLLMAGGFQRFSSSVLLGIFLTYAVVMGMSISFIFLVYTASSIYQTFGIASGMFGLMALVGYTTKTDLTKLGSILMMGLIGILIASVVNMFMHSGAMGYIISFLGVVIFTGLTAYDVQKLKNISATVEPGTESTAKLTIMGALTLYMDFINLFLMLLRFFGGRRD